MSMNLLAVFSHVMDTKSELTPLNTSYIILIPKKDNLQSPGDFRPISLLHRIQKIYSNVLANRL